MDLTTLMAYVFNCAVCTTIAIIFLLSPTRKQEQGKTMSGRLGIHRGVHQPIVH